jgi:prefoldin subunit 5
LKSLKSRHVQDKTALEEEKQLIQAQVVSLTQQLVSRQQAIEEGDKALQDLRQVCIYNLSFFVSLCH